MSTRRPSLIDQMAMAAALEGLAGDDDDDENEDHDEDHDVIDEGDVEDDEHENEEDDDEEEDDDDASSLENDFSGEFLLTSTGRMPRLSSGSRVSSASYGSNTTSNSMRRAAATAAAANATHSRLSFLSGTRPTSSRGLQREEFEDVDAEQGQKDDDNLLVGQFGSTNELILDDDIPESSYNEFENEFNSAVLRDNLQPGLHRASLDGRNHDEDTMYGMFDQPIQGGEFPHYDNQGVIPVVASAIMSASTRHSSRSRDEENQSDAQSQVDSEAFDQFDDDQIIDQQFGSRTGSGRPDSDFTDTSSTPVGVSANVGGLDPNRRPSFNQNRRTSYTSSNSDQSYHSAPSPYQYGEAAGGATGGAAERRRPLSIAVPNAEGAGFARKRESGTRASIRRQSVQIKSFATHAGAGATSPSSSFTDYSNSLHQRSPSYATDEGANDGTGRNTNPSGSIGSAVSLLNFRNRRSRHTRQSMSIQAKPGALGSLDNAIDTLRNQDSNSEWENVAAAVTVVAASEAGASASKSRHIKFAVNDTVLVFLTLLNVTNMEDPKDTFTVAPVNKYGYPAGEGRTDAEKTGPYTFVLCTVKHVHFDEDDRYYTVERADTGTEQRADSGWMEPINDVNGIEAARQAAKKTVRSTQDKPEEIVEDNGLFQECIDTCMNIVAWPSDFFLSTLLPLYRRLRLDTKRVLTNLLYGETPFSCKLRVTTINLLVLCSIAFLFLEVINLAFLSADLDDEMAIVGTVVWCILALELVFEVIIRPKNYYQLEESDKAFAPSTARYINRFHLFFEVCALITYVPEFGCTGNTGVCKRGNVLSRVKASADAIIGPTHGDAALGRFLMGITSLRFFSVIRHWKQMWINNTFHPTKREGIEKWLFPRERDYQDTIRSSRRSRISQLTQIRRKKLDDDETVEEEAFAVSKMTGSEEDQRLKNAATIGTALMVVNSQRALLLMVLVAILLPLLSAINQQNLVADNFTTLLESNNLVSRAGISDCEYLELAIESWLNMAIVPQPPSEIRNLDYTFVLWAQVLPVRCPFQNQTGVITSCVGRLSKFRQANSDTCNIWEDYAPSDPSDATPAYFAEALNLRQGGIITKYGVPIGASQQYEALSGFNVTVIYNENPTISLANMGLFYLLLAILILGLYFLTALRGDAIRLVLDPLQRMLKIVLRYAENPLSQDVNKKNSQDRNEDGSITDNEGEGIGNFETEQLINAITKIADLLRKCWGVAGAGIISSNLARTKDGKTVVFNPTVPGKRVYALFGFVAINGFSELLRALDRDVMILINHVAQVVHDEVYRWALGEHGQCNKNLGPAFLMVWRIGDFSEVHKKKQVATEKLFRDNATKATKKNSTNLRRRHRNAGRAPYSGKRNRHEQSMHEIQLESLPGIQAFTDRALLGMLKSFAGIHRDKDLNTWKNDFRLSAGVSAYHVDIMYGMDAGWAVEGAVGSEYKIDATYLSPHVNMASRMMSATKQYGVTILLSKAVEKLLSKNCRKKLRHLDTVYVKGSKVKQNIFTYDARFQGVDFFLLARTEEQADLESELYTPNIWDQDQDLRAMRQHISDEFMETYHLAVKQYLAGNWKEAYENFQAADIMMIERVIEDGYLEIDVDDLETRIFNMEDQSEEIVRIRHELGDGACRTLMNFMQRRKLTPPNDWDAVRQLFSK